MNVISAMLSVLAANATPITVPNASFELPSSPTQTSTNPNVATGWVFNVKGETSAAFINNDDPNVTDTLTSAVAPDTKYTLTLAIGNHNGTALYDNPGNVSFSLLANGVAFATQTVTNGTVPEGTFEDFTLTYTTPSSSSIIGDNLTINAFQPAFDNVTLDATSVAVVPEPPTAAQLSSSPFRSAE